jgi:hypothetical protein
VLDRAHIALRQRKDTIIVRPEQLDVVIGQRPVNEPILSPLVESPSSSRNGHSSVAMPEIPVAAATRIASSSYARGIGSLSDLKASGPVSSAPSAKRRERRVKIDSSTGKARAWASAPGCTVGRGTSLRRRSFVILAALYFGTTFAAAALAGAALGFATAAAFGLAAAAGLALAVVLLGFSTAAMVAPPVRRSSGSGRNPTA